MPPPIDPIEPDDNERVLEVDWEDVKNLPDGILSIRRMSWYLDKWNGKDLRRVLPGLNIFTEVPLACKGAPDPAVADSGCRFHATCPLVQAGNADRWAQDRLNCPIEIVEAFRHFSNYINNLDIGADDWPTIQSVNDLVRLLIQMRRCDLLIREEDPVEIMVLGVTPRGAAIESRKPNELFVVQGQLRKHINDAYKNLVASRDARLKERALTKSGQDVTDLMSQIVADALQREKEEIPGVTIPEISDEYSEPDWDRGDN